MSLRKTVPVLLLPCIGACAAADQNTGNLADAVIDSAGVQLVTHSRATVADVPMLEPVEELRIGSADGAPETQFAFISAVVDDADGAMWLYDPRNYRISVFDAQGRFLRAFGRRGDGPGEFSQSVTGLALLRDTVLVADLNRVSAFDRSGNLLQTQLVDRGPLHAVASGHTATPNGVIVMHQQRADRQGQRGGPFRDTITVRRFDPVNARVGPVIRSFPGPAYHLFGDAGWYMSPLFAPDSKLAIATNGQLIFSEGDDYAIDVHDESGALIRRVRADIERIPVTADDMREYMRRELADKGGGGEGVGVSQDIRAGSAEVGARRISSGRRPYPWWPGWQSAR